MSATATRRDAVTANVACRFRSGQRETKLLLHRARPDAFWARRTKRELDRLHVEDLFIWLDRPLTTQLESAGD
jgi:hypothetical protein